MKSVKKALPSCHFFPCPSIVLFQVAYPFPDIFDVGMEHSLDFIVCQTFAAFCLFFYRFPD